MFQGNPGTGKTTVGRILGKTFKELDLLDYDHFIEVTRNDLVGQYQGHTAEKTTRVLEQALGRVLFIEEVYSLVNGPGDDFGNEAINTIVCFINQIQNQ
ncbi:AAA family ATPase [Arcobacter sp. YIC-464]|uniref:AAA family ATPase n=1 Tax=Arcobacter sp. YIC-464 TaxID=3376631 RepID=UPI003C15AD82